MEQKQLQLGDFTFLINEWTLREQLERKGPFIELIDTAVMTIAAYGGADESEVMAAMLGAIMDGVQKADTIKLIELSCDKLSYKTETSGFKPASMENLEKDNVDIATIHLALFAVIKVNFGEALKKDLQGSIETIMDL